MDRHKTHMYIRGPHTVCCFLCIEVFRKRFLTLAWTWMAFPGCSPCGCWTHQCPSLARWSPCDHGNSSSTPQSQILFLGHPGPSLRRRIYRLRAVRCLETDRRPLHTRWAYLTGKRQCRCCCSVSQMTSGWPLDMVSSPLSHLSLWPFHEKIVSKSNISVGSNKSNLSYSQTHSNSK